MILAVDIGNTNIVLGGFGEDKVEFVERLSTNHSATALEYTVMIRTTLEINGISPEAFEGAILSSVVPTITDSVKKAVERATGKTPLVLGPGIRTGLNIRLDNPAQLGSDRVADAVGAITYYPCPLIIVDMGTATTISAIDKDRNFLGGMIIPGLQVSLDSLVNRTSQLPKISLDAPEKVIGRNTVDCMKSGIIRYTASGIDGVIDKIEKEIGEPCTVVSTGGLANIIIPYCERDIIIDEGLLLKGLMTIYNKNK